MNFSLIFLSPNMKMLGLYIQVRTDTFPFGLRHLALNWTNLKGVAQLVKVSFAFRRCRFDTRYLLS